jgi:hypothetical protein
MAKLDGDDLKAIENLIEVTVEDVIERKGVATTDRIGHLPTKDEFYGKMLQLGLLVFADWHATLSDCRKPSALLTFWPLPSSCYKRL